MTKASILGSLLLLQLSAYPVFAKTDYSGSLTGTPGLNSVPNARMYEQGTIAAGISTSDPYLHGFLGFQIAEPLYIGIRQSAEISNINQDAERLYPGLDFKLGLVDEGRYRPALSLGMQSAFGHKRMAGEYIALSKRYQDFDFTAGLGWGRFGSAGHFNNPLKAVSKHFGRNRTLDGEISNSPENWFTGESIGFFGGIEYFTPIEGLSLKADYGADHYSAERQAFDFKTPAPWSLGMNYSPYEWIEAGLAMQGADKIMGRLTLKSPVSKWPFSKNEDTDHTPMRAFRTALAVPNAMEQAARKDGSLIYNVQYDDTKVGSSLDLDGIKSTPLQLSRAAVNMANHAGPDIENITIRPTRHNLKGPHIKLNRRDLEMALAHHQGSAEEIWKNTEILDSSEKTSPFTLNNFKRKQFKFILDNHASLSEEDSGVLYRTSLVTDIKGPTFFGLLHSGSALRLNLVDNLDHIEDLRPQALLPVRSNVHEFADRRFALENAYLGYTHSFNSSWHSAITAGYLEEMYGGIGGEILYRPFDSRFAIGADTWLALKRDPFTTMNAGFNGDRLLTGHVNAWLDFPDSDLTLQAKVGRYLAEDTGATLSVAKNFLNGASLEGFITLTNAQDFDLFGGTTHAYHGISLSIPLGSIKHIPDGSEMRFALSPFGRDTGQSLRKPFDLYTETEAFSYDHIARYWHEITPKKTPR